MKLAQRRPPNWELKVHFLLNSVLADFLLSRELLTTDHDGLPTSIVKAINAIEANPARDWQASDWPAFQG